MNRGNNFHKTQQCEEEKIIKEGKGLGKKTDPKMEKKKNISFNIEYLRNVIYLSCYRLSFVATS